MEAKSSRCPRKSTVSPNIVSPNIVEQRTIAITADARTVAEIRKVCFMSSSTSREVIADPNTNRADRDLGRDIRDATLAVHDAQRRSFRYKDRDGVLCDLAQFALHRVECRAGRANRLQRTAFPLPSRTAKELQQSCVSCLLSLHSFHHRSGRIEVRSVICSSKTRYRE